jgi:hypothetical protein
MTALVRFEAWLYQFSDDEQEVIIQYALDHLVPRMKKLAASKQPARKALTPEHIANLHRDAYTKCKAFTTLETYTAFARAIEAAHGITGSEG